MNRTQSRIRKNHDGVVRQDREWRGFIKTMVDGRNHQDIVSWLRERSLTETYSKAMTMLEIADQIERGDYRG